MLYAELLHDASSLERGDELLEIIGDCRAKELQMTDDPEDRYYEAKSAIRKLTKNALSISEQKMADEDYANFGRSYLNLKREIRKYKERSFFEFIDIFNKRLKPMFWIGSLQK